MTFDDGDGDGFFSLRKKVAVAAMEERSTLLLLKEVERRGRGLLLVYEYSTHTYMSVVFINLTKYPSPFE